MINLAMLLKMSEGDKKFIFIIILLLFVLLSFLIVLTLFIEHLCKKQAKKIDNLMHDATVTGLITSKSQFQKVGYKKNCIYFYRRARIPMLIIVIHFLIAIIFMSAINDFNYNALWSEFNNGTLNEGGRGFATIFYLFRLEWLSGEDVWFGIKSYTLNDPHFSSMAIVSYFNCPLLLIGLAWFSYEVQGFLARQVRLGRLAHKIYSKELDNVKYNDLGNLAKGNAKVTITNDANDDKK